MAGSAGWRAVAVGVMVVGASVVGGGTAAAATDLDCPDNYVCAYEDTNWNRPDGVGYWNKWHVSELYDCKSVHTGDGWVSSVVNNTKFAFDLWDTLPPPTLHLGRMAPFKKYGALRLNDGLDRILSPGCP